MSRLARPLAGPVALLLSFLVILALTTPAGGQVVGDTVRLESLNPLGAPVHPAAGDPRFVRWQNGTVGRVTAVDPGTGWLRVESHGDVGWVVRKYLVVIPGEPEPDVPEPPGNEIPTYVVGTWNLEHFRDGASRGFPENTSGGPSYGSRTPADIQLIAQIITSRLFARILVLNEINGKSGENRSDELDRLLSELGQDWRYEIALSGDSQRVAIIYDSKAVRKDRCSEITVPPTLVQGADIFDRDPLACLFTFLDVSGQPKNDLIVVGVHLKSGQQLVANHNAAISTLANRLRQVQSDGIFPAGENDVLIGGDVNASRYDNKLENFWEGFDQNRLRFRTLSPEDGSEYPATRLAGVPLHPKSQIDYLFASSVQTGLTSHLVQSVAQVHDGLMHNGEFDDFREHVSDHLPVTVRVRIVPDDDP